MVGNKRIVTIGIPPIFLETFNNLEKKGIIPKNKKSDIIRESVKEGLKDSFDFFENLISFNQSLKKNN